MKSKLQIRGKMSRIFDDIISRLYSRTELVYETIAYTINSQWAEHEKVKQRSLASFVT